MVPPHVQHQIELAAASEARLQTGWLDAIPLRPWRVPDLPWYRAVEVTRAKLPETRRDLTRNIDRNVQHARTHPPRSWTPAAPTSPEPLQP